MAMEACKLGTPLYSSVYTSGSNDAIIQAALAPMTWKNVGTKLYFYGATNIAIDTTEYLVMTAASGGLPAFVEVLSDAAYAAKYTGN